MMKPLIARAEAVRLKCEPTTPLTASSPAAAAVSADIRALRQRVADSRNPSITDATYLARETAEQRAELRRIRTVIADMPRERRSVWETDLADIGWSIRGVSRPPPLTGGHVRTLHPPPLPQPSLESDQQGDPIVSRELEQLRRVDVAIDVQVDQLGASVRELGQVAKDMSMSVTAQQRVLADGIEPRVDRAQDHVDTLNHRVRRAILQSGDKCIVWTILTIVALGVIGVLIALRTRHSVR